MKVYHPFPAYSVWYMCDGVLCLNQSAVKKKKKGVRFYDCCSNIIVVLVDLKKSFKYQYYLNFN
jgi:hypothetical protein